MNGSDEGQDVVAGCKAGVGDRWLTWRLGQAALSLRAGQAVPRRFDGDRLHLAGGTEKEDPRRVVVPDLQAPAEPADGDGREGDLLQGEAEVLAVADPGRAVTADVG